MTRDYTRAPPRRTWTRSSRAPTPPGRGAKAVSSSAARRRSSWATIGRVGLDVEREALEPDDPAGAGRRRDALGDDRLEGRDRPRQAQLVLEPERARGVRDQVAEADHRPAPRAAHRAAVPATPARDAAPAPLAGRRPARTSQAVAIARSSGSRSSSVVVVTNACGSAAIRRTRCDAAVRVELAEDVVEEQERRAAVERGQDVELGELEGQDRRPLLAARGEARQVAAVELEDEVVAMRPDQRRAVPDLLLGGLGEPARQRVAWRLAGEWRRVRRVAQGQPRRRGLVGRDLRMGRRRAARPASRAGAAARRRWPPRRRGTPRPRTAARRARRPPRGSPAAGCCAAGASRP